MAFFEWRWAVSHFSVRTSSFVAIGVLLFAGASYAQNKQVLGNRSATLSSSEMSNVLAVAGGGSTVVCRSIGNCSLLFHDPFTSLAFEQPAIRFLLGMAETVHIEGLVYDGLDCQGEPGLAMGDLALVAPRPTVFLNFDPPLPPGTNL